MDPNGITTDGNFGLWGPRKKSADHALSNACCESQLVLIKWNLEKLSKKPANDLFGNEDAVNEMKMWGRMLEPISQMPSVDWTQANKTLLMDITDINFNIYNNCVDWNSIVTATEIDFIIHRINGTSDTKKISIRERDSMFDEMTKCLEFNKWGTLMLLGQGVNLCVSESRRGAEVEKEDIDGSTRNIIRAYQLKGVLLHFETREIVPDMEKMCIKKLPAVVKEDEQIELKVFQAHIPGLDDTHTHRDMYQIIIQKSVFMQIRRHVGTDDWGVVKLTDGFVHVTLYEEKSSARHIIMEPSPGERAMKFDLDFMAGIEKFKSKGRAWKQVYLEITKRFISNTQDAVVQPQAALAEMLAARFQSITWV